LLRARDLLPDAIGEIVIRVLVDQQAALESGAIVTIDEAAARVRILPVRAGRSRS